MAEITAAELAEHYRLAMLECERHLRLVPVRVIEPGEAINPTSKAISEAVTILWQARQDAIFGKIHQMAKAN
jgi:hypothetical protein